MQQETRNGKGSPHPKQQHGPVHEDMPDDLKTFFGDDDLTNHPFSNQTSRRCPTGVQPAPQQQPTPQQPSSQPPRVQPIPRQPGVQPTLRRPTPQQPSSQPPRVQPAPQQPTPSRQPPSRPPPRDAFSPDVFSASRFPTNVFQSFQNIRDYPDRSGVLTPPMSHAELNRNPKTSDRGVVTQQDRPVYVRDPVGGHKSQQRAENADFFNQVQNENRNNPTTNNPDTHNPTTHNPDTHNPFDGFIRSDNPFVAPPMIPNDRPIYVGKQDAMQEKV